MSEHIPFQETNITLDYSGKEDANMTYIHPKRNSNLSPSLTPKMDIDAAFYYDVTVRSLKTIR